jgi:hypothetical protein
MDLRLCRPGGSDQRRIRIRNDCLINMGRGRAEDARNLWLEAPEIQ